VAVIAASARATFPDEPGRPAARPLRPDDLETLLQTPPDRRDCIGRFEWTNMHSPDQPTRRHPHSARVGLVIATLLVAFAAAIVGGSAAVPAGAAATVLRVSGARAAAFCTAAEKARRLAALKRYRAQMKSARRAYFRSHRSARARRAFVARQEAKLRALKRAATCRVVPPGAAVVASIPAGGTGGVGVGAGSVWVSDRTSGLLRIDPTTNTQVDKFERVFGGAPVVGEGAVWVPSGTPFYNSLLRVDPQAHTFIQIPTGPSADEWPVAAVVTPGAVWVGNHHGGPLVRVDPRTNKVVATIPWSGPTLGGIYHTATDGSTIWVTGTRTTDAAEVDVAANAIVRRIDVPNGTCGGIDVGASSVWVASGYDQPYPCWQRQNWGVSRIDRSTGRVTRIDIGGRPIDVRVGLGSIWAVLDAPKLQLVRIDPARNVVVGRLTLSDTECRPTVVAGACPAVEYTTALAVGFGSLWLRVNSTMPGTAGRLLRLDPK